MYGVFDEESIAQIFLHATNKKRRNDKDGKAIPKRRLQELKSKEATLHELDLEWSIFVGKTGNRHTARQKFVEAQISTSIAAQIRALRKKQRLSQPMFAEELETTQNQMYRLENARLSKPKITTLKKIAAFLMWGELFASCFSAR